MTPQQVESSISDIQSQLIDVWGTLGETARLADSDDSPLAFTLKLLERQMAIPMRQLENFDDRLRNNNHEDEITT